MGDLISRQAAIETVMECYDNDELFEVYEDKLRELPPAQPEQLSTNLASLGTDCISRQAAIEVIDSFNVFESRCDQIKLEQMIGELPPVQPEPSQVAKDIARIVENGQDTRVIAQPERIKGHWIDAVIPNDSGGLPVIVCDKCNTFFPLQFGDSHNFCPNCGADMREVTE